MKRGSLACRALILGGLMAGATGAAAARAADDPVLMFETLYGARVEQVRKTPDASDDLALAKEIMEAGQLASDQRSLQVVLYDRALGLAERSSAGYEIALEAIDNLLALSPQRASELRDRALELHRREFRSARGDARAAIGERLVDATVDQGDDLLLAGESRQAVDLYRSAVGTASAIRSPRLDAIQERVKWASNRAALERQADRLAEQAGAGGSAAARTQLIDLYIAGLNDLESALPLARLDSDYTAKMVDMAMRDDTKLSLDERKQLAAWYEQMGARTNGSVRHRALSSASNYYKAVVDDPATPTFDRLAAKAKLEQTDRAIAALGNVAIDVPSDFIVSPLSGAIVGRRGLRAGGAGGEPYQYVAPPDVTMVGLHIWVGHDGNGTVSINAVQPIYAGDAQSVDGPVIGRALGNHTVLEAPAGSIVSAVEVTTDGLLRSIRLHFVPRGKVAGAATDVAITNWVGAKRGKNIVLAANGRRFIGVYGAAGYHVDSLGLIVAMDARPAKK